jgi:hypothetical protein
MESVHLALSKKQHAALRLGRKVRLNASYFQDSGVEYIVHPETFDRIHRKIRINKGVDLALHPTEIQASGRGFKGNLRRAGKVLNFIGEKNYKPIAKEIAPVAKPIFSALTGLAVSKINNTADPTARYLNAAARSMSATWWGPFDFDPS